MSHYKHVRNQVTLEISRKISKRVKETLVGSPSLQIQGSTLWRTGLRREEKRRKRRGRLEVEEGMLWTRFTTEAQKITHSCEVTIYNRPPFLLLAVLRLERMKKAITPFFLFSSFVSRGLSIKWDKHHSLTSFFTFALTSTRICTFSACLYIFMRWF